MHLAQKKTYTSSNNDEMLGLNYQQFHTSFSISPAKCDCALCIECDYISLPYIRVHYNPKVVVNRLDYYYECHCCCCSPRLHQRYCFESDHFVALMPQHHCVCVHISISHKWKVQCNQTLIRLWIHFSMKHTDTPRMRIACCTSTYMHDWDKRALSDIDVYCHWFHWCLLLLLW